MVAALLYKVSSFVLFSVASQNPQVRQQGTIQIPRLLIFQNVRHNFPPCICVITFKFIETFRWTFMQYCLNILLTWSGNFRERFTELSQLNPRSESFLRNGLSFSFSLRSLLLTKFHVSTAFGKFQQLVKPKVYVQVPDYLQYLLTI